MEMTPLMFEVLKQTIENLMKKKPIKFKPKEKEKEPDNTDYYEEIAEIIFGTNPFIVTPVFTRPLKEQYDDCMANDTVEKMQAWFDAEAKSAVTDTVTFEKATEALRERLAEAVEGDGPDALEYLYNWLEIEHPKYGTPEAWRKALDGQAQEVEHGIHETFVGTMGFVNDEVEQAEIVTGDTSFGMMEGTTFIEGQAPTKKKRTKRCKTCKKPYNGSFCNSCDPF